MDVKTISTSGARANFSQALKMAEKGEIVLIQRGNKPNIALVNAELLEDYLASVNQRIIEKVNRARSEKEFIPAAEVFSDLL